MPRALTDSRIADIVWRSPNRRWVLDRRLAPARAGGHVVAYALYCFDLSTGRARRTEVYNSEDGAYREPDAPRYVRREVIRTCFRQTIDQHTVLER